MQFRSIWDREGGKINALYTDIKKIYSSLLEFSLHNDDNVSDPSAEGQRESDQMSTSEGEERIAAIERTFQESGTWSRATLSAKAGISIRGDITEL